MSSPSPKEFFSRHALDYAKSAGHAAGADLKLLVELLKLRGNESVLDVATGTGFTAMEVAPMVSEVSAVDITAEMPSEAKRLAAEKGTLNLSLCRADAGLLPYRSASFGAVTCRRAAHHFGDLGSFLGEAVRVLKVGGRLGVADMSPVPGTEGFVNRIEALRDHTHVKALAESEWLKEYRRAGLEVASLLTTSSFVEFGKWLSPVAPGGKEEAAVREEFERAPQGLRVRLGVRLDRGMVRGFVRTWAVVVGTKV